MDFQSLFHTLGIEPRGILIQIVGFIVLFLLLKKFLFKPVGMMLDARADEIRNNLSKAEEQRADMERIRHEYEARIEGVESEARARIQAAIKEAQAIKDEIIADSHNQAKEIIERGQTEIQREKEKAMVELREEVASLAVSAAGKVLEKNLDEAEHRRLIDDFISKVGASS
ncbi:MAG: F0F1 ATP synthase subunit B [Armatimonadetes bacterium]|nr:F0F1 ATP synthase subunit B [Armatimonadota bacterium]